MLKSTLFGGREQRQGFRSPGLSNRSVGFPWLSMIHDLDCLEEWVIMYRNCVWNWFGVLAHWYSHECFLSSSLFLTFLARRLWHFLSGKWFWFQRLVQDTDGEGRLREGGQKGVHRAVEDDWDGNALTLEQPSQVYTRMTFWEHVPNDLRITVSN